MNLLAENVKVKLTSCIKIKKLFSFMKILLQHSTCIILLSVVFYLLKFRNILVIVFVYRLFHIKIHYE